MHSPSNRRQLSVAKLIKSPELSTVVSAVVGSEVVRGRRSCLFSHCRVRNNIGCLPPGLWHISVTSTDDDIQGRQTDDVEDSRREQ